tara:strand:+ start:2141 stop:2467 length:327 start_codon:yes stop_codon:yes gene_type:complete
MGYKMKDEGFGWLEVLFWIVMAVLVGMILTRVFGHSATDVQIYIGIVSGFFLITGYMMRMNREIGEIKVDMKHGFDRVGEEFGRVREDFHGVGEDIKSIKDDISKLGK